MIGIIGGTGPEGYGLAVRWTRAGKSIGIGSRSVERAEQAADKIREAVPEAAVTAGDNARIAAECSVAIIAVPFSALSSTVQPLEAGLSGKLVVSVVASLEWSEGRPRPLLPEAGSAAQEIQRLLADSLVTSAFHTLSAEKLADLAASLDEDCIVCGDDRDARRETMDLARIIDGVRPLSGGRLEWSIYPELLVGMLATINRIHKVHAGLKIVGFDGG